MMPIVNKDQAQITASQYVEVCLGNEEDYVVTGYAPTQSRDWGIGPVQNNIHENCY